MKALLFSITILGMTLTPSLAQTFESPVEYLNFISESYEAIRKETWDYVRVATSGKNARKIEKRRQDLINALSSEQIRIKKMPAYNGDSKYRDDVVGYLKLRQIVFKEDFGKILNLEEIAEESYDAMEAYLLAKEKANEKLNDSEDVLIESQKEFANNNNIRLVEGELDKISKKLNKAGNVIQYYNKVYLVFFKVYKEEFYYLEAANQSNVGQMEQHRKSLLSLVKEAKSIMDTIPSFQQDGSIKTGCLKMLNFYQNEATVYFPKFTDFHLKKEEFETVNKAFSSMKKVQKTKVVVDNYNKAVNDYNNSINDFNKANEVTNKGRTKNLNDWNKTIKGFMDRNMP